MLLEEPTHDLVRSVDGLQLLCDLQSAIRRRVVDDDDFPLQVAASAPLALVRQTLVELYLLFGKGLVEQPDDDGKVASFVVRGKNDRVLVLAAAHRCCWIAEVDGD